MGQEIAYCTTCGTRLRSVDFDKGQAFRHQHLTYCKNCAPEDVRTAAQSPPAKSSPALLPRGSSHQVSVVSSEARPFPLGIFVAVIIVVLLAVAALLTQSSRSEPASVVAPKPLPPAPPIKVDPTTPPHPPAPKRESEDAKVARERIEQDLKAAVRPATDPPPPPPPTPQPAPPVPPPPPAPDPEAIAYRAAWQAVWIPAAERDPAALKPLEDAARDLRSPALKAEADLDLKLFRQAAAAVEEGLRLLAATPKGESLSLKYRGETGVPRAASGVVKRIDKSRVEIGSDAILVGEVLSGSLIGLVRTRSPRKAEFDPAALELASLLENVEDARIPGGAQALPGKYWEYSPQFQPEWSSREANARKLFYQAERDAAGFETAGDAARGYKSLLADFGAAAFVRRNQGWIASRSDLAKDFVFMPADLKVAGSFKPASGDKVKSFWKSSAAGDNSVELAFSTVPGAEYRAWVYIGGCCLESLTFSSDDAPVKQSLATTPKTHAEHGAKINVRWGWVPLPKVSPKKIRLVARGDAFSIAYAVVSATRQAPPKDAELAEIEKLRPDAAARAVARPPAEVLMSSDFSSEGAVHPVLDMHRGDFPLKFSGFAEIGFAPSQGSGDRTTFLTYARYPAPFRVVADLEFTRRDPKAMLGLRLQRFEGTDIGGSVAADAYSKYEFHQQDGSSKLCEAPPAGRELWTIDLADDMAIWSVNGKEVHRMSGVQSNQAYQLYLYVGGSSVDPEAKVRIRNLTIEKPKR